MKLKPEQSFALSLLLPLLWLAFLRLWAMPYGENCYDGYYHVAMAEAGPEAIFSKSFPSMTMSVWENSFSDKEALYHLFLGGVFSSTASYWRSSFSLCAVSTCVRRFSLAWG
jgi:hypothetical protein